MNGCKRHCSMPDLIAHYQAVRGATEAMCSGLSPEDCNLQAMPETSPAKWHMAHTSWFFDAFVLEPFQADYVPHNPLYRMLFNSYYNGIGAQYPRPQRGLLSRPSLDEVYAYRAVVDLAVNGLLAENTHPQAARIRELVELGLHHEAQHQELLLTDIKYSFFQNPLSPAYREGEAETPGTEPVSLRFIECPGGEVEIGHVGKSFCFDNELPRHTELVAPFRFANRLVTSGRFMEFVEGGGYLGPEHWLSDGWVEVQNHRQRHPLYWRYIDGQWFEYTLHGLQPLDENTPVSHISYFEAQAFASWAGKRLPTEGEWESVAQAYPLAGNFMDSAALRPRPAQASGEDILQLFGDCWEWTNSAYLPYPGYRPLPGAVGEYNGKFMSNQMVLRGGSCLSHAFHIRPSYRNFFYPGDRWQCTGIRLAADI